MASEVAFRQLFCRRAGCGEMFFICRPCFRGQVYCSEECRQWSRREQRRKANQRYREDPEVRRDHREQMRQYRRELRESRVADQSSAIGCGWGSIGEPLVRTPQEPTVESVDNVPERHRRERFIRIVCRICGRIGRFVAARIRRE
jgi:hypothetical protein